MEVGGRMKNSMADAQEEALKGKRLEGGIQNFWHVPLMTKEEIRNLDFKRRLCIRTKIWLFWWYAIFAIVLGGLSIIHYVLEIFKAFKE